MKRRQPVAGRQPRRPHRAGRGVITQGRRPHRAGCGVLTQGRRPLAVSRGARTQGQRGSGRSTGFVPANRRFRAPSNGFVPAFVAIRAPPNGFVPAFAAIRASRNDFVRACSRAGGLTCASQSTATQHTRQRGDRTAGFRAALSGGERYLLSSADRVLNDRHRAAGTTSCDRDPRDRTRQFRRFCRPIRRVTTSWDGQKHGAVAKKCRLGQKTGLLRGPLVRPLGPRSARRYRFEGCVGGVAGGPRALRTLAIAASHFKKIDWRASQSWPSPRSGGAACASPLAHSTDPAKVEQIHGHSSKD